MCRWGHFDAARWLVAASKITAADAKKMSALYYACGGHSLVMAQWLVDTFDFAPATAAERQTWVQVACGNTTPAMSRWIVAHFGLTCVDASANENALLEHLCKCDRLSDAKRLVEKFRLTSADAKESGAFWHACGQGNLGIARWLAATFDLSPAGDADWSLSMDRIFRVACDRGRLDVAQWFAAEFSPEVDSDWVRESQHEPAVAAWLRETVGADGAAPGAVGAADGADGAVGADGAAAGADGAAPGVVGAADGARPALAAKIFGDCGSACVVCLDAPAVCAFSPCGHAAACVTCAARFAGAACPVCRAPIKSVWQLLSKS
jgi:Zinc finger, C3HC4 type (RING finger)